MVLVELVMGLLELVMVLLELVMVLVDLDMVLVELDLMVTDLLDPLSRFPTELLCQLMCQLWWLPEQTTSLLLLPQGFDDIFSNLFIRQSCLIQCARGNKCYAM